MNNNNNNIDISQGVTFDQLPNRVEPYNHTDDCFYVGPSNFRIFGVANVSTQRFVAEYFTRGPISIEPLEECPICFENFDTTEANNGEGSFPDGFSNCPVKFECGYTCCFGCFHTAYCNMTPEEEIDGFRCFSCRQFHHTAIFLEIKTPTPPSSGDELIRTLIEEAEVANRSRDFFERKYRDAMKRLTGALEENAKLKRKISRLGKKKKQEENKKKKVFFPVAVTEEGPHKKFKSGEEEEEDQDDIIE